MRNRLGVGLVMVCILLVSSFVGHAAGSGFGGGLGAGAGVDLDDEGVDSWARDWIPGQGHVGGGNLVCRTSWAGEIADALRNGLPLTPSAKDLEFSWTIFRRNPEEIGERQMIQVLLRCYDGEEMVSDRLIELWIPIPENLVPPEQMAIMARDRLPFRLPGPQFAPPLTSPESFLLVQLPTWIWTDDWVADSRTVTAGEVSTTTTATPVRLEWNFPSSTPNGGGSGSCTQGDVAYNTSISHTAQATPCSITFQRPSTREPGGAYSGEITVVYHVTWSSTTGESGDLGEVPRSTAVSVRVGEQQVLTR